MISFLETVAFVAFAFLLASANGNTQEEGSTGGFQHGVPCTPCPFTGFSEQCIIKVRVNFFASETGYFEIDDCIGVNPTLYLTVGRTYLFDQSDDSNWYHLIGFSYEVDGDHVGVDELEPGIAPGDSDCRTNMTCPAPMYWMDGEYAGVYSNIPSLVPIPQVPSYDFGLDVVMPLFFHPLRDWQEYGPFVTTLNFDVEAYDKDIFYFCQTYEGMSARIKLRDVKGKLLNPLDTPALPHDYYSTIAPFDYKCGTVNLTDYSDPTKLDTCPDVFVCKDDDGEGIVEVTHYSKCVEAMNCHMMASMTTNADFERSALFCHQMIPHNQNAINMVKALLKSHDLGCNPYWSEGEVPWECFLLPVLHEIINIKASQNLVMRSVLAQLNVDEYENCDVEFSDLVPSIQQHAEPDFLKQQNRRKAQEEDCTFVSGMDCKPCDGTDVDCVIKVGVNLHAGQSGYYFVEGCDGVSPTLHLEVGRTYLFDQSDVSNWYHLIIFSYYPDGGLVGEDELKPGIQPGKSNCWRNLTCPAPMYWMNNEYTGEFSNIDSLVPLQGSDDYGLDTVGPLFEHPFVDWTLYGPFVASLNFDVEDFDQDIFYCSNSYAGMSGRIKLIGSDGSMLNEADTPEIPYDYDCVSPFDRSCGTFNTEQFQPSMNPQCPEDGFICYDGGGSVGEMANCVDAMNCAMLTGMTVVYPVEGRNSRFNDVILFLSSMIPHHQNAVNMAKNLLASGEADCNPIVLEEGPNGITTGCILEPIVRSIINTHNIQIQYMQELLLEFRVPEVKQCNMTVAESNASVVMSLFGVFVALFAGIELLRL